MIEALLSALSSAEHPPSPRASACALRAKNHLCFQSPIHSLRPRRSVVPRAKRTMSQLIGQSVGHYHVLERIGAGGMGEVYLARDSTLDRFAALKFLPPDLANDQVARTRLAREARAAAALDHPYICKVYAIGDHHDQMYLALEYIDGQTLQRVLKGGLLPLERVAAIVTEICEALGEAHKKGIVHRDLKPSNLMFTEQGHIKVLDFGLAKRHELNSDSDAALTETGMAIGTIPYMSPEQLNGDQLAPTSDLFSVGTLLYEMLTGVHPFGRRVNMETAMAILTKAAPPMHRVGERIPANLVELVQKLLSKSADSRPQTAAEVVQALSAAPGSVQSFSMAHEAATAIAPRLTSSETGHIAVADAPLDSPTSGANQLVPTAIAVLPFARLSADPDDEYFGDGLADEITTALAHLRPIRVVARTSAFAFKGRNLDVREIGRELGADTLLQGSIRRAGSRVRIGVQLVSAADGGHLWSETFDRELTDVFAVQDEIAQSVVATLRLQLGSGSMRAIAVPRTHSLEAYQLYLQARHQVRSHTQPGLQQALRCYEDALSLDPEFAPAMVGCAEAYITLAFFAVIPAKVSYPKAKELVTQALQLDPNVDNARGVMSSIRSNWEWNFKAAEDELRTGIASIPSYAAGHYTLSVLLSALGRSAEALASAQEASRLDPLNSTVSGQVGLALMFGGRFDEAETSFRASVAKHPADAMPAMGLSVVLRNSGRYQEALEVIDAAPKMLGGIAEASRAACLPELGRPDEARAILSGFEAAATEESPIAYVRASIHEALGEVDQCLDLLEIAADHKEAMVLQIGVAPWFCSMHGLPRFEALKQRIGLP